MFNENALKEDLHYKQENGKPYNKETEGLNTFKLDQEKFWKMNDIVSRMRIGDYTLQGRIEVDDRIKSNLL